MWHYLCDPMFSSFDTILSVTGKTHRQTHDDGIYNASIESHGKNRTVIF